MTGQSQAQGTAAAIETSVQVALRIRPIITDPKNVNKARGRAETEVLSVIERSPTPSSLSSASGAPAHDQPQQVVVVPVQRYFTFDHVFGTNATQEEIYQGSVKRMVDKFMEGYNVTIMAYGQTSSGKTYTMGTGAPSSEDRGSPSEGIIPRAVAQLFHDARKPPPVYPGYKIPPLKTSFRVSFVEIYNEDLIDLLAKGDFRPPVTIREDTKGNIFWTGVQEIAVASVEEVIHLLWYGSQNRQTHSTEMNEKSSRSHAIFSITLRQEKFVPTHPPPPLPVIDSLNSPTLSKNAHPRSPSLSNTTSIVPGSPASIRPGTPTTMGASSIPMPFSSGIAIPGSKLKRQSTLSDITALTAPSTPISTANDDPEPDGEWVVLNSKFHFVDLAGSERLKRTSAIGDRAKEGISINAGLHALGNVISALGDPSKKASHVPYRDSKLTRLLQDSLGGNALALMIACVSPSEINLNETLNTLKYANRARNIKNSSTLNQEVNMDNPEYLRSIIQKLKMEIKMLKEANTKMGVGSDDNGNSALDSPSPKTIQSGRLSIQSTATFAPGGLDDALSDRAFSPSPSTRLSHYQSRESLSTDISHSYLDAVQEEEDRYSDISSTIRTDVVRTGASSASETTATSPTSRPNIAPLVIPQLLDTKSFQEFVEPVIEEYEKVISGLETHLAMTQAALNHSELILEEQQGRIDIIEDENRMLLRKQQQFKSGSGSESDEAANSRNQQKELQRQLQTVQQQLKEVEERKAQKEQYIEQLEQKLAQEKEVIEERIQEALKKKEEELLRSRAVSPHLQLNNTNEKEQELKLLSERVLELEEQIRRHQEIADAETATVVTESDQEREERESKEAKCEEELIEKREAKAALERELESEKVRQNTLDTEAKESIASHTRTDSAHTDSNPGQEEGVVQQLAVTAALIDSEATKSSKIDELEAQLAEARESERLLKEETVILVEKLEKLQKDHASVLEKEEMLHLAVSDLEERLKISQESESKHLEELEKNLARIQNLEERSTKAELEALRVADELKDKLAAATSAAEGQYADELLELLEKMEVERTKVEALQTQVESHLVELAAEKSRAAELESSRDEIQAKWDADKERIQILEKEIEQQSTLIREKVELIASLGAQVSAHEGTIAAREHLEQELNQRTDEYNTALASKAALILELEQKITELEMTVQSSDKATSELVGKIQTELSFSLEQLNESQAKTKEQEQVLQELKEKMAALDAEASSFKATLSTKETEHTEAIQALQAKIKLAEADRDEAETRLEEVERRHQAVDEDIKALQATVDQHLATIEILQSKLSEAEAMSLSTSRPVSVSSSATNLAVSEDASSALQRLEKEKSLYKAIVRENEKQIEQLSQELESLASEFLNTVAMSEAAEEEMKARITELQALLEEKNESNSFPAQSASHFETSMAPSSMAAQAQISALKAERDQALQSSEELSSIIADLNEQNHSLQERLLTLEREQEAIKLQHVLESQTQQNEIRMLKDRAERLDRNASPSPVSYLHDDDRERILQHKPSNSSDYFMNNKSGEDSLATPRQSWSTTASGSQQPNSQLRNGRHESTLIQQAKHIKMLEERIAELQANAGSQVTTGEGNAHKHTPPMSSISAIGLGIHHKNSDPELARSVSSPIVHHHSTDKMSPALRGHSTLNGPTGAAPPTPPPQIPLPPPPASAAPGGKVTPAHLNGNAPSSPRIGGTFNLETSSPHSSPSMRPSRAGSINSRVNSSAPNAQLSAANVVRRERDSTSSNVSEPVFNAGLNTNGSTNGHSNGWASPTGSTMSVSNISAATAQALQGVEVNELRGVVDTLAHQVQALKVEQAMQQGKIQRLEAALAEAEERLKVAQNEKQMTQDEKVTLAKEIEKVQAELTAVKLKSEKDRQELESILEKERREREKAVEARAIMEAKMEELMGRKKNSGLMSKIKIKRWSKNN